MDGEGSESEEVEFELDVESDQDEAELELERLVFGDSARFRKNLKTFSNDADEKDRGLDAATGLEELADADVGQTSS